MLVFGFGGASGVFHQDIAVHAAVLLSGVPVAFRILVALSVTIVATTVAAELALGGSSVVAEPNAVSGVFAGVEVGVQVAGWAANIIDVVPNTFTSGVGLVVAVGGGGVGVAGRTTFTRAVEFEDEISEETTVGHILSVEGEDGVRLDLITVATSSGDTSGEGGPVDDVTRVGVEVGAAT